MENNRYQVQCDVDADNHLVANKNIETGKYYFYKCQNHNIYKCIE